jgi:hypothetical protein
MEDEELGWIWGVVRYGRSGCTDLGELFLCQYGFYTEVQRWALERGIA